MRAPHPPPSQVATEIGATGDPQRLCGRDERVGVERVGPLGTDDGPAALLRNMARSGSPIYFGVQGCALRGQKIRLETSHVLTTPAGQPAQSPASPEFRSEAGHPILEVCISRSWLRRWMWDVPAGSSQDLQGVDPP